MRLGLLAVALCLVVLVGCGANRAEPETYPIPNPRGRVLDPASDFVKKWPGRAAVFKLSDQLVLKIPPIYQKFWLQGNRVKRTPIEFKDIPSAELIGFQFFVPDFSGYTADNYLTPFSEELVDVIVEWVGNDGFEDGASGYYPPNMYKRLVDWHIINLDDRANVFGLVCFGAPSSMTASNRYCYGPRDNGEYILLQVMNPPYDLYVKNPLMIATYLSKAYGGTLITWRADMRSFQYWKEIDAHIWALMAEWDISLKNSTLIK